MPEGADSKGSKGLQWSWFGSRRDDSEVDRVLQPLVGTHVPVIRQSLDTLASLIGPNVDVGGGVPARLASLRVLSVVTESCHDTSTFGHLPDSIVLEASSKGSQLDIYKAQHPGESLPGRVEGPEYIQLGPDGGEGGEGDEGEEEGFHRGHDSTSGPMDLSSLGVTELRELNEADVVHVLKRRADEYGGKEKDIAEVMEEGGEGSDSVFLLVSAQLLRVGRVHKIAKRAERKCISKPQCMAVIGTDHFSHLSVFFCWA